MDLFADLDPRLAPELRAQLERRRHQPVDPLPLGVTIVLAGHRAAGKSTLAPRVAQALGLDWVDLDRELERRVGRPLREWLATGEEAFTAFRRLERKTFLSLPRGVVVAVGGGFLSSHPDALQGALVVLVPITFETYVDRLSADVTRPRLRPGLAVEEELREVYFEREEQHRAARALPLVDFALRLMRGLRPRRVVTLPPGVDAVAFAWQARHAGADLLEVRTDLTPKELDLRPVARALPLLVAERGAPVPPEWLELSPLVDRPRGSATPATLRSFHAERALSPAEALAGWPELPAGVQLKHVEPLGSLTDAPRLFETQRALQARFGARRVTVLAHGKLALPFRALLARHNALDYLALDGAWAAAEGQRLVADARREWKCGPLGDVPRLGILGSGLSRAASPRIHAQPFDRLDLPSDTDMRALLAALAPWYRGFAVTAPFKRAVAAAVGAERPAVNLLVRGPHGWLTDNTDVDGAAEVLAALGSRAVTVLGDGGVTVALREAAAKAKVALTVRRHRDAFAAPVTGAVVWTWPAPLAPPAGLRFAGATVGIIAYGAPARAIAAQVAALGGVPKRLGPRWFIAQARGQRARWRAGE